jgi:3-hydroxyisobutyrate dehydrogenase-like beta-hydroxyacid dehydrogenase
MGRRAVSIAVFGLGEAGSAIAADLAEAGARVAGFDPAPVPDATGVRRVDTPADAVAGADVVLAITAAADAATALEQALDAIPEGALYADLATASPALKRSLDARSLARGLEFADVALMAPVPGRGLRTPALVSGRGAQRYADVLVPFGAAVEVAGGEAGLAATRKLLRSVVVKGLTAVVIEAMRAADAAGLGAETWDNVVDQITSADERLLRRLVEGTRTHSRRRLHEMEATVALLEELGVEPLMTSATVESLRRLDVDGVPPVPDVP